MYIVSVLIILVVVAVYLALLLLTQNVKGKTEIVNQRIQSLEAQLKTREPLGRNITAFRLRLVNMEKLLKSHVRWSSVLSELERLVIPSARVVSLEGGLQNKAIEMSVVAPDIGAAADLLVSLQNVADKNETFFNKVQGSSIAPLTTNEKNPTSGYSTTLKFDVKDEAFVSSVEAATATPTPTPEVSPAPANNLTSGA